VSVVIAVKVSEGLVLAADSAATLQGQIQGPQGVQSGILKTYTNARKLLQIGDFPIGVLTWGQAFLGLRTVESIIREWEHKTHLTSREQYSKEAKKPASVKDCAEGLRKHLVNVYDAEFQSLPKDQRPGMGFLVAGYSDGEFFPEMWRFVLPIESGQIHNQRPDVNGKPEFGASWFGLTDPIVRLHFGRDDMVLKIISEKFKISEDDLRKALTPLEYPIPFAVMPLQDAIDYANYMINVAIGRFRFVLGPELCGGQVDIAAITQSKFDWISRKAWKLR
jgi:hypothetical protein